MRMPGLPRLPRWPAGPEIPWMMFLGHYMAYAYGTAVAVEIAWDAAGEPQRGAFYWITQVFWLVALATFAAEFMQHREHLCERCAAATPLDPQKQVVRWKTLLRLTHVKNLFWIWLGIIAVQVAVTHAVPPGPLPYAVDAAVSFLIGVLITAVWVHNRLQPWCPYCRWGKGGEHEEVPDPDPAVAL
jgi:hypothetical protein